MSIPHDLRAFWNEFQAAAGAVDPGRFYESFHFDDNEQDANALATLVLAGIKRATAALLWSLEASGKAPPTPGALSVVTTWHSEPLAVIETTRVTVVPFDEVSESFASREGEGDATLRYWRDAHWAYFSRECQRIGREPSDRMPVVCEEFSLIYPSSDRSAT